MFSPRDIDPSYQNQTCHKPRDRKQQTRCLSGYEECNSRNWGSTTITRNDISQRTQPQCGHTAVMEYGPLGRTAQGHLGIDEKS